MKIEKYFLYMYLSNEMLKRGSIVFLSTAALQRGLGYRITRIAFTKLCVNLKLVTKDTAKYMA